MDTTNTALPAQAKMLIEAKARRAKALAMRRSGKNNREIGEAFGITPERARQLVAKAFDDEAGQ